MASACLFVVGLLALFSVWLDYKLGLIALAIGSFGLVASAGMLLTERVLAAEGIDEPERRSEAIWGWLKAAIMAISLGAALVAGAPLGYVFGLLAVLVVISAAGDIIIGVRAARRMDGKSGEPKCP